MDDDWGSPHFRKPPCVYFASIGNGPLLGFCRKGLYQIIQAMWHCLKTYGIWFQHSDWFLDSVSKSKPDGNLQKVSMHFTGICLDIHEKNIGFVHFPWYLPVPCRFPPTRSPLGSAPTVMAETKELSWLHKAPDWLIGVVIYCFTYTNHNMAYLHMFLVI